MRRLLLILFMTAVFAGCEQTKKVIDEPNFSDSVASSAAQSTSNYVSDAAISIQIEVGEEVFSAKLYDNETTRAFLELFPVSVIMKDLNANEKYYYFSEDLPSDAVYPERVQAGDIMLFGSDCLVVFYESFSTSYSYTPMGVVEDIEGFVEAMKGTDVSVSFTIN